ncbi:uncharacterized protein LOC125657117 [Ostrea edulis]|uniref:uncharacterized protein LOC125657117 n=1 Tax=Ostrea edulis TaxID=37623 RepID=UPI0024AF26C3|nr:uncharacterized protein LOC125657117 [Ostrea edulis]
MLKDVYKYRSDTHLHLISETRLVLSHHVVWDINKQISKVMGQIWSSKPVICKKRDDLVHHAWNSLDSGSVNDIIILEVKVKIRGMYGYTDENSVMKELREYTPLVIACMFHDVELVKRLIEEGADINLRPNEYRYTSTKEAVPPLYYAAAARDPDIVKILLNAGADVNGFRGRQQFINLQKPESELYSIIEPLYSRSSDSMATILDLYLAAGVKLNTTCWGPCLFYGRGKVYSANLPTTLNIPGPYFTCDTAILLLQHGVDPNLYKLRDVIQQFSSHNRYFRDENCVDFDTLLKTFLAAGYHYTNDDLDNRYIKEQLERHGVNAEEARSLKQTCRSVIREHLRTVSKDTSLFPFVEKLPIPESLKTYLKLCNIIDLKNISMKCKARF